MELGLQGRAGLAPSTLAGHTDLAAHKAKKSQPAAAFELHLNGCSLLDKLIPFINRWLHYNKNSLGLGDSCTKSSQFPRWLEREGRKDEYFMA